MISSTMALCRVSHSPATLGGGHWGKGYPGGTTDVSPEGEDIGNLEIRGPVDTKEERRTQPVLAEDKDAEDEDGQRREPPSKSEEERQRGRRALGDGGQKKPRTLADHHVPGGAWLRQMIEVYAEKVIVREEECSSGATPSHRV
ncbi:hypothetical protein NDU88_002063 [Pleurodeles waltl]|uniref:Uncharacterized protein n=1 Tax=Pleurodeles waltl TaxID=8319 RepID=A0AAV7TKL0_PLEWA|nr:hypothetical protein NDU88_002063 [Pleurodeles waltl]